MSVFHMTDCIRKTKEGIPLHADEIRALVRGITDNSIPDYQLSAWLMAVCLRGLTDEETIALTLAMRDSGDVLSWNLDAPVTDKHSTGGIGDKTTLILAPIVSACGVYMPKMSGRGLGFTGGTIDKLESIPGLRTALSEQTFRQIVSNVGFAVCRQTANLAPADKKLYALRDVTETVNSIPLICASIMSKKLATGADHILLDVKVGSGAFMKNDADAHELARLMCIAAQNDHRHFTAYLTDMNKPLGRAVGNAIEVREAISVLSGETDAELGRFCISFAAELLTSAGISDKTESEKRVLDAITSGAALERLARMIAAQGGDARVTEQPDLLKLSPCSRTLTAPESGYIAAMQSDEIGHASVLLGAGRLTEDAAIDYGAGILLQAECDDAVRTGDPLLTMYAAKESQLDEAEAVLKAAIRITPEKPAHRPLIHGIYPARNR